MKNNSSISLDSKLIEYIIKNPNLDTDFVNQFYGLLLRKKDIKNFYDFCTVVRYRASNMYALEIARLTGIPKRRIEHWIHKENYIFPIRILTHYLDLEKVDNESKLLSLNSTRGGLFTGSWIRVPTKIKDYLNLKMVLDQLSELSDFSLRKRKFALYRINEEELFAYFLGFLIGDASKTGIKRKQRVTRRIHIRLSKHYPTNKRLGDFVTLCVNSFGLRMNQRKDCPPGKLNPCPFYTWISQSSLFFQWVFDVCLGLKNNMTTTYDPINASWILGSPREFKIKFLQGLADSDGFVDFSARQVGIITHPNTDLIVRIFESLGVKTRKRFFTSNGLWSLMFNIKDAYNLPIFNEYVRSYRYKEMEKLFQAKRYHRWPKDFRKKVDNYIKSGYSGTELVKKILQQEGVIISTKQICKIKKNMAHKNKEVILGVECTAL